MQSLMLAAIALAATVLADDDAKTPVPAAMPRPEACQKPEMLPIKEPSAAVPRKLGEEPPGDLIYAVANMVEGCLEPIVIRENLGN